MDFITRDHLPNPLPPRVWCDFNSADEDGRYWALGLDDLAAAEATVGVQVLLWDWEEEPLDVLAQVAVLEAWSGRWCARPLSDAFYSGPLPW
jgi:hypothetical protein